MSEKPPAVLALDPSITMTGWAFRNAQGFVSGRKGFETPPGKAPAYRFHLFSTWLAELLDRYKPALLVYEDASFRHQSHNNLMVAVGLRTRIQEQCALRGIRFETVMPKELKKAATTDGNADKVGMKARARELCGDRYSPANDPGGDEADAICLLAFKTGVFGKPPEKKPKATKPRQPKEAKDQLPLP